MMRILATILLSFLVFNVTFAGEKKAFEEKLQSEANEIVKGLNLDNNKAKLVYNVVKHFTTRVSDLGKGELNYERLIGYIEQERLDMMQVALSKDEFKKYVKLYSAKNKTQINNYIEKHKQYISQNPTKQQESVVLGADTYAVYN